MRNLVGTSIGIALLAFSSCCYPNEKQPDINSETILPMNSNINATQEQLEGITTALNAYIEAAIKGDSNIAKPVFAETATISHVENDSLISGPIQELFDYYDKTGPHNAEYEITSVQVAENVAIVSIDSKFGDARFDDMFTLIKDGNDWKIVSKVFRVK